MPRTHFKIITVGSCTNCSPLPQAGVYQSAEPTSQTTNTFSAVLLWPWRWKFGGEEAARGGWGTEEQRRHRAEAHVFWLVSSEPQLKRFNQPLGSVLGWGGAKSVWGTRLWRGKRMTRNEFCRTTRQNVNKMIRMHGAFAGQSGKW